MLNNIMFNKMKINIILHKKRKSKIYLSINIYIKKIQTFFFKCAFELGKVTHDWKIDACVYGRTGPMVDGSYLEFS